MRNSGSGLARRRDRGHDRDREADLRALRVGRVLGHLEPAATRRGGGQPVGVGDAAGHELEQRLRVERGGAEQRAEDEGGNELGAEMVAVTHDPYILPIAAFNTATYEGVAPLHIREGV